MPPSSLRYRYASIRAALLVFADLLTMDNTGHRVPLARSYPLIVNTNYKVYGKHFVSFLNAYLGTADSTYSANYASRALWPINSHITRTNRHHKYSLYRLLELQGDE